MTNENKNLCPCGCGKEPQKPTGLGDTPFVSIDGRKVPLATNACREKIEKLTEGKQSRV